MKVLRICIPITLHPSCDKVPTTKVDTGLLQKLEEGRDKNIAQIQKCFGGSTSRFHPVLASYGSHLPFSPQDVSPVMYAAITSLHQRPGNTERIEVNPLKHFQPKNNSLLPTSVELPTVFSCLQRATLVWHSSEDFTVIADFASGIASRTGNFLTRQGITL